VKFARSKEDKFVRYIITPALFKDVVCFLNYGQLIDFHFGDNGEKKFEISMKISLLLKIT